MIQCEYCGKRLQEVRTDGACNNCTTLLEELGILRRTLRKLEDGDLYNGMKDLIKIAEEKRNLKEFDVSWEIKCTKRVLATCHEAAAGGKIELNTSEASDRTIYVEGTFDVQEV